MMRILVLWIAGAGSLMAAGKSGVDELVMARAEAKAYREAWLELKRRDELLGVSVLSPETRDSHDKVARLAGELIRAEKSLQEISSQAQEVVTAAVKWAGESDSIRKAAARSDFESARRSLEATLQSTSEPRALASGLTEARVVAVSRDPQALILNLGSVQGAREGMPFRILRNEKVIGRCRLIEVRELTSAGLPEGGSREIQPEVGDRVAVLAEK